jgi:hypothetical protein
MEPGRHPWVGAIGITNDDMSSLRPTTRAATVQGQPLRAHAILFEHINFRGAHKHVFAQESNLAASDDWFFNDRASSLVILSETWRFFRHINFVAPYPKTLGKGLHPWVVNSAQSTHLAYGLHEQFRVQREQHGRSQQAEHQDHGRGHEHEVRRVRLAAPRLREKWLFSPAAQTACSKISSAQPSLAYR